MIDSAAQTFTGSAFFFAEDAFTPTASTPLINDSEHVLALRQVESALSAPFIGQTALDRYRAVNCLTTAIYYEAANEPDEGQRAVAQVVLNRVRHPAWPNSVCGVVYQGSERTDLLCQFTFSCDGAMARLPVADKWARARRVAEQALAGRSYAPAGLATFYHTLAVRPDWSSRLDPVAVIGAHIFYQMRGNNGTKLAFNAPYSRRELIAGPAQRAWKPLPAGAMPVAMPYMPEIAAFNADTSLPATQMNGATDASANMNNGTITSVHRGSAALSSTSGQPATVQDLPGQKLPQSTIRPEYQNSGRPLI
ncbi:MAG: cell wall hydrolase [Sphingobium sp.]|nr:cell wall hydrolase [Sphingobium sp.]